MTLIKSIENPKKIVKEISVERLFAIMIEKDVKFAEELAIEHTQIQVIRNDDESDGFCKLKLISDSLEDLETLEIQISNLLENNVFESIDDSNLYNNFQKNEMQVMFNLLRKIDKKFSAFLYNEKNYLYCSKSKLEYYTEYFTDLRTEFLKSAAEELKKPINFETNLIEINPMVNRYLSIGDELNDTLEIQNFQNLITSIYNGKDPYNGETSISCLEEVDFSKKLSDAPFIFICASSGTGKTQLAFYIKIPFIYLILNEHLTDELDDTLQSSLPQLIYLDFLNMSKTFLQCVKRDLLKQKTKNKK